MGLAVFEDESLCKSEWVIVFTQVVNPEERSEQGIGLTLRILLLRSELGGKREGLLEMRWTACLLFPALLAHWWGGGPVAIAEWLGKTVRG